MFIKSIITVQSFFIYLAFDHSFNTSHCATEVYSLSGSVQRVFVEQISISAFEKSCNTCTEATSSFRGISTANLKGRNVNVATFNCSLFSIINPSGDVHHDGIEIRMLRELAHRMNFTWTLVELKGIGKWGEMLANGSWVGGIMGALEVGEADIGFCNVWNVLRYIHAAEFGPQYNVMYFSYLVPRPRIVGHFFTIIINLFDRYVWLLLSATFALVSFLYSRFRYVSPKSSTSIDSPPFRHGDKVESALVAFGVFIATTSHVSSRPDFPSQVMFWWSAFSFFMSALICNTIITRLMIPQLSHPIDSVEDIVNANLNWGEPGYDNISKRSIYFNTDDPWQFKLESNYRLLTKNTSRAALRSGKYVLPVQRLGTDYVFINVDGLEPFKFDKFRVIKQTLNYFHISFAFRKHSPLLELCRPTLQRFYEHGLVEHWKRDVVLRYGDHEVETLLAPTEAETFEKFRALNFTNMKFALIILLSGWALSVFMFIIELVFKSRCKRIELTC